MTGWRRITSQYPRLHTVYWARHLEDGRSLAVVRQYEPDGSTPRYGVPWLWKVYAAPTAHKYPRDSAGSPRYGSRVLAHGEARNVQAGRRLAADAAASMSVTWKRAQ